MKQTIEVGGRYAKGGTVGVVKGITQGKAPRVQVLAVGSGERTFVDVLEFSSTWRKVEAR